MQTQGELNSVDGWRQGYSLKNEKIYIFSKSRILVAKGWPQPMAWSRTKTITWHPTRNWADKMLSLEMYQYSTTGGLHIKSLGFDSYADISTSPYWQQKHESTFGAFVKTFPVEIFNAAMEYPERRWQILCLLSRCPTGLDLHKSNPAILFCLANNWVFHKPAVVNSMRAIRGLIGKKQRDILCWLGFPNTENARYILSKIDASEVTINGLLYLRDTLNQGESIKHLSHLPKLNWKVLRILCDSRTSKLLSYSALEDILNQNKPDKNNSVVQRSIDSNEFSELFLTLLNIKIATVILKIENYQSIKKVNDCPHHLEKLKQLLVANQFDINNIKNSFPIAPYLGNDSITPISNNDSLELEGKRMHNCVSSRAENVILGREYIYHVSAPIRATLSINKSKNGFWELNEIRGFGNKLIDPNLASKIYADLMNTEK